MSMASMEPGGQSSSGGRGGPTTGGVLAQPSPEQATAAAAVADLMRWEGVGAEGFFSGAWEDCGLGAGAVFFTGAASWDDATRG
ncbi:hypothetical protein, partial [Pyxidicoccus fallax]|uniref:hypothetical protein n=1 Tax=Pyxidicoccus fallax TaxID=394095 RepID=UPI001B7D4930